jgi:hypothetical protein
MNGVTTLSSDKYKQLIHTWRSEERNKHLVHPVTAMFVEFGVLSLRYTTDNKHVRLVIGDEKKFTMARLRYGV